MTDCIHASPGPSLTWQSWQCAPWVMEPGQYRHKSTIPSTRSGRAKVLSNTGRVEGGMSKASLDTPHLCTFPQPRHTGDARVTWGIELSLGFWCPRGELGGGVLCFVIYGHAKFISLSKYLWGQLFENFNELTIISNTKKKSMKSSIINTRGPTIQFEKSHNMNVEVEVPCVPTPLC